MPTRWTLASAANRARAIALAVLLAIGFSSARTVAVTSDECSGCSLTGELSVSLASVVPPQPVVGDTITLTFDVFYRLPGAFDCEFGGTCQLQGGDGYLTGSESPMLENGQIVVQRQVIQAGMATVELLVSATTEEQCAFLDPVAGCSSFFQEATIHATSGPIDLELLQATPTITPSPTPTAKPKDGGGGCMLDARDASDGRSLFALLAPAIALFAASRVRRVSRAQPSRVSTDQQ